MLSWNILDSGAIYRAVAFCARENNLQMSDELNIRSLIKKMTIKFQIDSLYKQKILINRKDASEDIRSEECGSNASIIAKYEGIRNDMIHFQRSFLKKPGLIADGRDMGTVIFPEAALKIFLEASPEIRAERRANQLKEKGMNVIMHDLLLAIKERDKKDMNRNVSPLRPAKEAIIIDTSKMSIIEVEEMVMEIYKKL